MVLVALMLSIAALTPQEIAEINREQEKAIADVAAKYGNRKLNELSAEERRQHASELAEAQRRVLEKHRVDAHEWALSQARQGREDREAVKKATQALEEKEKAEAEAAAAAEKSREEQPVVVQRGFNDDNPVVLEEVLGKEVVVEQGLPPEAKEDQELAAEQDRLENQAAAAGARPAPRAHRGRGRK